MKPNLLRVIVVLALMAPSMAAAVFVEERLSDSAEEIRAREISEEIRCLVCQNQSIMDSNADLAKDLRGIVRERVAAGDSDDEVRNFLVVRYGDWVLLNPPFKMQTLVLWLGPLAVFIFALIATILFLRRRSVAVTGTTNTAAPLNSEEKNAFEKLMNEEGGPSS